MDSVSTTVSHGMPQPQLDPKAARKAATALYLIVFVSGAVLMGVEIAGAKILAPSFGTSQFVWGSIIGLFMGALALGYYVGGALADRKPSFTTLAGVVTAAGLWTAVIIPRLGPGICEAIARGEMGTMTGPLLACFAVFFIPSFLMGIVSPYSVKLNASSLAGLGGVTGKLYALSTFGSIVGTIITTFFLIPTFKLSNVLTALGFILILVAGLSWFMFRSATGGMRAAERTGAAFVTLLALMIAEAWIIYPVEPPLAEGQRLINYDDSPFHEILVTEDVVQKVRRDETGDFKFEGYVLLPARNWNKGSPWWIRDTRRWLKFNENIESGIYPYRDEHTAAVTYTDLLHLPLMWVNNPLPKKVLVVGGGGGIIPTQFYSWYNCDVDVAEIDAKVEKVAREFFQVPDAPQHIKFHIGDGRQTVRKSQDKYDIIFLDAYSSGGQIPFHLLTWEFLNEVKSKLTDRGVLVTNIISGIRNMTNTTPPPANLFLAEYKTLRASRNEALDQNDPDPAANAPLFNQIYVFPKVWASRPMEGDALEEYRNVIVVATREKERRSVDQLEQDIAALTKPNAPVIKATDMLWHVQHLYKGPSEKDLSGVPVLRDDYAPVDLMYRPVKRDENSRRLWNY